MSYVENNLSRGEEVAYSAKVSKWIMVGPGILAAIFALIAMGSAGNGAGVGFTFTVLAIVVLMPSVIRIMTTEMAVTNKKVIAKTGLIARSTIEMSLPKVESVQVHQTILGRILGYGTIIVSGAGNPQAPIRGISNPLGFRKAVLNTQEEVVQGSSAAPEGASAA